MYCMLCLWLLCFFFFFFQAEDGIRDAQESRGLGDVYKRQVNCFIRGFQDKDFRNEDFRILGLKGFNRSGMNRIKRD